MNIKMARNSQLSTTKNQQQTKQTSRTKSELEKWRSHGRLSEGYHMGGKVQEIRSIIGRHKIVREKLRIV